MNGRGEFELVLCRAVLPPRCRPSARLVFPRLLCAVHKHQAAACRKSSEIAEQTKRTAHRSERHDFFTKNKKQASSRSQKSVDGGGGGVYIYRVRPEWMKVNGFSKVLITCSGVVKCRETMYRSGVSAMLPAWVLHCEGRERIRGIRVNRRLGHRCFDSPLFYFRSRALA